MRVLQGCKWPNLLFRLEASVDMRGQNPICVAQLLSNLFDIPGLFSVDIPRPYQQTPGAYPKPPTNSLCFGIPATFGGERGCLGYATFGVCWVFLRDPETWDPHYVSTSKPLTDPWDESGIFTLQY